MMMMMMMMMIVITMIMIIIINNIYCYGFNRYYYCCCQNWVVHAIRCFTVFPIAKPRERGGQFVCDQLVGSGKEEKGLPTDQVVLVGSVF